MKSEILENEGSKEEARNFQLGNVPSDDEPNVRTLDNKHFLQMILQLLGHKYFDFQKEGILCLAELAERKIDILANEEIRTSLSAEIATLTEDKKTAIFLYSLIASLASLLVCLSINCEVLVQEQNQQWISYEINILVMFLCNHEEFGDIERETILLHLLRNGSRLVRSSIAKSINFCKNTDFIEMINAELIKVFI
jgi:hypothetical protein